MNKKSNLVAYLKAWANERPTKEYISETILQIAQGSIELAHLLRLGELATDDTHLKTKADGDTQISMDVVADDIFYKYLKNSPVAVIASEETEKVRSVNRNASLAVAIDPLDGSSNVNVNMTIGTIFTILPFQDSTDPELSFMQKGCHQLAAGFTLYGPQTLLVLSVGTGTHIFILDDESGQFRLYQENMSIPVQSDEYAINASNQRHWTHSISEFIEDCNLGTGGRFAKNFNTRWTASAVADVYRILNRGGVYLYPGDKRKGYEQGRLRLVYEANPIALLVEQAGGMATDGSRRILDIEPTGVHQRTPLVFGSRDQVQAVSSYHTQNQPIETHSPLFGIRGLFQ